jgi:flavin reductase (DIM6/NTAB) family NADH-FMN oxidoreductase RutF
MSSFENLRIVDNFYQTSLFSPMPTVIISTLCEDGTTTLGPYSLVQPYYVAGKDYYAMLLSCRNSSNTAQNILRNGKCAINFIDDSPKTFKEAVKLSWPGDKPSDKMPKCKFKLEDSLIQEETGEQRPQVLTDAIEVIECTWVRELDGADKDVAGELNGYEPPYHDFNGITSKFGAHFILKIDKILMKKKYSDAIIRGVKASDFPPLPVDYGYRDSKNFWFHRKTKMRAELLQVRQASLESVRYAADRVDDVVKFTDDALQTVLGVPRVFLPLVLKGCVQWAKENGVTLITAVEMKIIQDKRAEEKKEKEVKRKQ